MLKDCGDIKIPEVPKFDASKLPTGVNLPAGMSIDSLKAKAENPGFSDRLKNAGNAIGANIKNTVSQLNPAAIADKAAGMVSGMVGNIKDSISNMADGLTSLKNKIAGFDPAEKLKGLSPDSPAGMFENMKNQAKSKMDGLGSAFKNAGVNCGKTGLGAAGDVSSKATSAAAGALGGISMKDRISMAKSPQVKQAKIEEATQQAAQETTTQVTEAAKKPSKEKSVQQQLHSATLPMRLGVELGDCTGYIRELFMNASITLMIRSMMFQQNGFYPSHLFKKSTGGIFGTGVPDAANNAKKAITRAAEVRAFRGILHAVRASYDLYCDEPPSKEGIMDEKTGLTYHDYMINNYYNEYSHDTNYKMNSSQRSLLVRIIFGRITNINTQQRVWKYWREGADALYTSEDLHKIADLSTTWSGRFGAPDHGFWTDIGRNADPWYEGTSVEHLEGKKPLKNFQDSFDDDTFMTTLTRSIELDKQSWIGPELNVVESIVATDSVLGPGSEEIRESQTAIDILRSKLGDPSYIVDHVTMPVTHYKMKQLFPQSFMIGIQFNYDTKTIDSMEYLGENELLKEHIK